MVILMLLFVTTPTSINFPLLRSLQWLPIKSRIEFKTCLLTYKTFSENPTTDETRLVSQMLCVVILAANIKDSTGMQARSQEFIWGGSNFGQSGL